MFRHILSGREALIVNVPKKNGSPKVQMIFGTYTVEIFSLSRIYWTKAGSTIIVTLIKTICSQYCISCTVHIYPSVCWTFVSITVLYTTTKKRGKKNMCWSYLPILFIMEMLVWIWKRILRILLWICITLNYYLLPKIISINCSNAEMFTVTS